MSAREHVAPRSTFVSVVAWIFIVLSGFSTLIALLQNAMVFFVFQNAPGFDEAMRHAGQAKGVPRFFPYFIRYFQWVFLAFLALSLAMLASSIGLLRRQEWARRLFIGLMAFGIFWNFAGLGLVAVFMTQMPSLPPVPPSQQQFATGFYWMLGLVVGFNVLIAIAFAALFYWIIRRLRSPEIRREFA